MISRFAAIIENEEQLEKMLSIVQKYKNGITLEKIVMILNKLGYREKVMQQLTYLGLIEEGNDARGSFRRMTEKGVKVLANATAHNFH